MKFCHGSDQLTLSIHEEEKVDLGALEEQSHSTTLLHYWWGKKVKKRCWKIGTFSIESAASRRGRQLDLNHKSHWLLSSRRHEEADWQGDREHQWWLWRGENLTAHWGLSLTWIDLQTHTCTAYSRKSFFISVRHFHFRRTVLAARENSPDASPSHFRNFVNVVLLDLVSFIGSFDSFMTSTFRVKPPISNIKESNLASTVWYHGIVCLFIRSLGGLNWVVYALSMELKMKL